MNNWSCLPAAFAKCIGISLEHMVELVGHDGSAIAWPGYPAPLDRRGFHIQEILYALHKCNYSVMPVGRNPSLSNGRGPSIQIEDEFFDSARMKLGVHLGITESGINHAVSYIPIAGFWCPNHGYIADFHTREIWLVHKCTGNT